MRLRPSTRPVLNFDAAHPPDSLCLLRLSALGDVCHVLPTLRTLQTHWPTTKISWVIGKGEYPLVEAIDDVEFIIFDKAQGWRGLRALKRQLAGRHFDVLLHMQLSLRASLVSTAVPARLRLGFDRPRARNGQWLFCNAAITPASTRQHVLDSFLEFPRAFGLSPVYRWQLPVNADARAAMAARLDPARKHLVINPCAVARSRNWRNWTVPGYAALADHAAEKLGMQVILSGGPSKTERQTGEAIVAACRQPPLNLIGQTRLDELVALLELADAVVAPDTGPVHIASALGAPTIGLYATTNPQRAGPYNHLDYVVNAYPQALQQYEGLSVEQAPWGKRIRTAEAMTLIRPDTVIERLEALLLHKVKSPA